MEPSNEEVNTYNAFIDSFGDEKDSLLFSAQLGRPYTDKNGIHFLDFVFLLDVLLAHNPSAKEIKLVE